MPVSSFRLQSDKLVASRECAMEVKHKSQVSPSPSCFPTPDNVIAAQTGGMECFDHIRIAKTLPGAMVASQLKASWLR